MVYKSYSYRNNLFVDALISKNGMSQAKNMALLGFNNLVGQIPFVNYNVSSIKFRLDISTESSTTTVSFAVKDKDSAILPVIDAVIKQVPEVKISNLVFKYVKEVPCTTTTFPYTMQQG